jgi:hypothetical protein
MEYYERAAWRWPNGNTLLAERRKPSGDLILPEA